MLEFINSGVSGYVYEGRFKNSKKSIALKFFGRNLNKEKKMENIKKEKEKFENQNIAIIKKLHKNNIVEIYANFKNDKINFSILELAKYGDIKSFNEKILKRKTFSETALNYFARQILEALHYSHKSKIVHFDVKPGHILIDSNLQVKLTGFSVSYSYSEYDPEKLVKFPFVGTGKYMSPEMIERAYIKVKEVEKMDIYSFGVSLYYLFYGEYPYGLNNLKNDDYESILKKIKEEKLEFPEREGISEMFKNFLEKLLEKDYNKRLNIKQALGHPWMKGSQIIFDEKEIIDNLECFLNKLVNDFIPNFNEYIGIKCDNFSCKKCL